MDSLLLYSEVQSASDDVVKARFGTSKTNVLKVVKTLLKEEIMAEEEHAIQPLLKKDKKHEAGVGKADSGTSSSS